MGPFNKHNSPHTMYFHLTANIRDTISLLYEISIDKDKLPLMSNSSAVRLGKHIRHAHAHAHTHAHANANANANPGNINAEGNTQSQVKVGHWDALTLQMTKAMVDELIKSGL